MRFLKWVAAGSMPMLLVSFFSLAFAEEVRYDSGARRDPMTPLVGPDGIMAIKFNPDDLNIEGIIYDSNRAGSLVLINGEFYKEGQTVKNSTVITILKERVILRQDDEEKTLWIRDEVLSAEQQGKPVKKTGPNHEKN